MRLRRALYGLRQSPNVWNSHTIDTELQNMGFKVTASDPCVCTRGQQEHYVMITLFVDDILVTGPSIEIFQSVQDTQHKIFNIRVRTCFTYFRYGGHQRFCKRIFFNFHSINMY
ncbi:unnamed protein product [Sphacelaria rigidula]